MDRVELPRGLTVPEEAYPIVFVDIGGMDMADADIQKKINSAIYKALCYVHFQTVSGQALLKVHVGEPKCITRMKPEYTHGSVCFLKDAGAATVVAGDTTVAYSGPRGHKQNPSDNVFSYLKLAQRHGWSPDGPSGIPFVVLDRPSTAIPGKFEFGTEEEQVEVHGIQRFNDVFLAPGFRAADFVINHAHLTLHGLAGVAGCVKSIAMGCASYKGKLRMHQSLLPHFDPELCVKCGRCVENCPENALEQEGEDSCPTVIAEICIGCGECQAVCEKDAISLQGEGVSDWQRGKDSLPLRMADYTIGLMNGRWKNTIHVLHMYSITEQCDCLNIQQEPMLKRNLGFLVGKNPFVIDQLAGKMLDMALHEEDCHIDRWSLKTAETSAAYVKRVYGVLAETPMEKMSIKDKKG